MRIGVIGLGWVGSSVASSVLHMGTARELLLNDIDARLAEGEAMDLAHGASFYPPALVRSAAVEDLTSCDAVVIAAGRGGRPGETRLALRRENAGIVRDIAGRLSGLRGTLVVVTNPVDVMTLVATRASGLPPARVVGTGTMLDTARLRQMIGRELRLDPRSIHAQVVGEHGDSEVVLWSGARVGGLPLARWPGWAAERQTAIAEEVRSAALEIIARKGATNHAIGLVTAALLRWMLRGDRRVLTISRVQDGALGLRDVALSLPTVVGADGATDLVVPDMTSDEREALARSAEVLRGAAAEGLGEG
jgi:L-lactate dehydrogenase